MLSAEPQKGNGTADGAGHAEAKREQRSTIFATKNEMVLQHHMYGLKTISIRTIYVVFLKAEQERNGQIVTRTALCSVAKGGWERSGG